MCAALIRAINTTHLIPRKQHQGLDMGFKDKLVAHTTTLGGRCTVGAWYDKQTPDIRADFDDALEDDMYTSVSIANLLRADYGANVSGDTLARHRRNACRCGR